MLNLLLRGRYPSTEGGLIWIFIREVLMKKCNILRRSETSSGFSRGFSR